MYSDSHKAQRNSFSHHRAEMLVSIERAFAGKGQWSVSDQDSAQSAVARAETQRQRLRAGLVGFVSAGTALAL